MQRDPPAAGPCRSGSGPCRSSPRADRLPRTVPLETEPLLELSPRGNTPSPPPMCLQQSHVRGELVALVGNLSSPGPCRSRLSYSWSCRPGGIHLPMRSATVQLYLDAAPAPRCAAAAKTLSGILVSPAPRCSDAVARTSVHLQPLARGAGSSRNWDPSPTGSVASATARARQRGLRPTA